MSKLMSDSKKSRYQEDILMLVIPDSKYSWRVPVQIGTGVIDKIINIITPEELKQALETWRKTHNSRVITGKVSQTENSGVVKEVKGKVAITKPVKVPPYGSTKVKGTNKFRGHSKCTNLIVEQPEKGF